MVKNLKLITLQIVLSKTCGPVTFKKLFQEFETEKDFVNIVNKNNLINIANLSKINTQLEYLNSRGYQFLCVWEDDYPVNLKNIPDSPIIIFYKGNKELLKNDNLFSIVGSRRMSKYGIKYTNKIVAEFKNLGFYIVSGMANGIDSEAHWAAIRNGIPTIAILASEVNTPTPPNNRSLYNEILKHNGLILSETLPIYPFQSIFFPRRNRIIAGISKGTLIVEAGKKSGSLITANFAQHYNKEVFAIPGSLDSSYSIGSNALIKNSKAKLIQDINDILDELSIKQKVFEAKNLDFLNEIEKEIYKVLSDEPKFVDEITNFLKLDFSVIISSCSSMEVKGFISKNEKGQYYLI